MPPVGHGQAQRNGLGGVAVDALVGDVEVVAIAVEQLPERAPAELLERVGVAAEARSAGLRVRDVRGLQSGADAGPGYFTISSNSTSNTSVEPGLILGG